MIPTIPTPVIAVVADVLGDLYTHSHIENLMEQAGLPGDPPPGNKVQKARAWLMRANADGVSSALEILGRVICELMEVDPSYGASASLSRGRERVREKLAACGLEYIKGGHVIQSGASATVRGLDQLNQSRDLPALRVEFDRILENTESDPDAAATAACALLELLFRIYIEDEGLQLPSDRSIKPLWALVRAHLKIDAATAPDEDLRKIVGGLASIADGVGCLRTHQGSAHGHGRNHYALKPRYARLAANAASTLATFVIETWGESQQP